MCNSNNDVIQQDREHAKNPKMVLLKKAFDIPGINNQKGVLAQHLGLDEDDKSIEERATSGGIHHYVVGGKNYVVAAACYKLNSKTVHTYNSSLWSILLVDNDQPYVRFTDKKVANHLKGIAPQGFSLVEINQKEQRVLFKNVEGVLVVWSYTAHVPEDISTYFFQGSVGYALEGFKGMFNTTSQ
jgi:hypothetical protein